MRVETWKSLFVKQWTSSESKDPIQNNFNMCSPPMGLRNEEDIENLSRYLIEDNYEEFVEFDEELTLSVIVVKSILRNLLGAYQIYNDEEMKQVRGRVREVKSSLFYKFQKIPKIEKIANLRLVFQRQARRIEGFYGKNGDRSTQEVLYYKGAR